MRTRGFKKFQAGAYLYAIQCATISHTLHTETRETGVTNERDEKRKSRSAHFLNMDALR